MTMETLIYISKLRFSSSEKRYESKSAEPPSEERMFP